MITVINGKRYNTKTAEQVACWDNDYPCSDFHYCYESLYRTKKGAWFLVGEGGPLSKYSAPCGNGLTSGSTVLILSDKQAMDWLERHDEVEALDKYFSDSIEDA